MPVPIGELLLKEKRISAEQLQAALNYQRTNGGKLGANLVKLGYVKDEEITALLSKQYGVPSIALEQFQIDPAVIKLVPADTARKYQIVPLSRVGTTLTIAMTDPTNVFAMDDVKFMTGYNVEPVVASEMAVLDVIHKYYGYGSPSSGRPGSGGPAASMGESALEMAVRPLEDLPTMVLPIDELPAIEVLPIDEPIPSVDPLSAAPSARPEPVEFSAYFPVALRAGEWQPLLAYVHVPSARIAVEMDSQRILRNVQTPAEGSRSRAFTIINRGAEIRVVPTLQGCEFNPPSSLVHWMEQWHRLEFRVRTTDANQPHRSGMVRFFVGAILVGEVPLWADVGNHIGSPDHFLPSVNRRRAFSAVFVSYSHEDRVVVDRLEEAYAVLGLDYVRDIRTLRSGDVWSETLLQRIPTADVFQLCWSNAAKASPYVEREWRCALELGRSEFIRPMYWQDPLPVPPSELSHLHFARLQWLPSVA